MMSGINLNLNESQKVEMNAWHDKAMKNIRANINVFARIINECPNKNTYQYHKLVGILVGRQSNVLIETAKWHPAINLEKITLKSLVSEILERNKN